MKDREKEREKRGESGPKVVRRARTARKARR